MKRRTRPADEPVLFDLPLAPADEEAVDTPPVDAPPASTTPAEAENLALFPEATAAEGAPDLDQRESRRSEAAAPLFGPRLRAGLVDLAALGAVLLAMILGTRAMSVAVDLEAWPAFAVALLVFSFLYHTLPLAFWGRTPGMALAGLVARSSADQPLTFGQTFLRWLGSIATAALAGLPLLAALTGRSLTDRISGSYTARLDPSGSAPP